MHDDIVIQFSKMLGNLDNWLEEATRFAGGRELDASALLNARLYPDQFSLTRQIQAACDTAKLAGARVAGVEAPVHEDGDATLEELRTRIAEVRSFLEGLDKGTVDEAASRDLTLAFLQGRTANASDYVREFAVPNFYFHLTTAYSILRNCGVKLGKRTYLGSITLQ